MANVRETDGVDDKLFLNGGGVSLAGWGLMWVGRMMSLTATQAIMAAVDSPSASQGVLYYDSSQELSYGSGAGDTFTGVFTLNATDLWLLGFSKTAGASAPTFHAANLTTGAAAGHQAGGSVSDVGGTWDQTEIGTGDGGTFFGNKRHGTAAVFTTAYSNANFDTVAAAKTTQSIYNLTPARLWDFNQASTATAVVNLMTGTADQASIVQTTVVSDTAFDIWTFGLGATAAPTMPPAFNPIPFMR